MSDETIRVGMSQEEVAFRLFETVAQCEQKKLGTPGSTADRQYILSTYAECLMAVASPGQAKGD